MYKYYNQYVSNEEYNILSIYTYNDEYVQVY